MLSILYVSDAVVPFSEPQLAELLLQSRASNEARGLTGMLLYKDGQFMQALEGEAAAVRERFDVISADARHTGVRVLSEETTDSRQFGEWAMGYRSVTDEVVRDVPGYHSFFEGRRVDADEWGTPSRARLLLEWFRYRSL